MKRKSPIHHTVKRHKRQGKWVGSFERGSGKKQSRRKVVVGSRKRPSDDDLRAVLKQIKGVDDLCDYCAMYYDDDCDNCEWHVEIDEDTDYCRLVEMFTEREGGEGPGIFIRC